MVNGQTKIQQTAFMLIAITLFFVLVGLFVIGFRFSSLKDKATSLEEENAMLLASKLANTPEFACGESFGNEKINCIDADKILALKSVVEDYSSFWGVTDIKIIKIYPSSSSVSCSTSNHPDCGIINLFSDSYTGAYNAVFVTLCWKEADGNSFKDKCELAKLLVAYEKK